MQIVSQAMFRSIFALILSVGFSAAAVAQTQDTDIRPQANQLIGKEIKSVFSDVTMDGAYNFGRNGKAQSFYIEKHNPDGTLTYLSLIHI